MIAALRGKSNAWPIFWFNLLLGWAVVGFVVAFVLAISRHAASGRGILGPTTPTLILLRGWCDHSPEGTRPEHVDHIAAATPAMTTTILQTEMVPSIRASGRVCGECR
jgi:hypothetical protein